MKTQRHWIWMLPFVLGGLLLVGSAGPGIAWALSVGSPAHQTVPTLPPTRIPSPSAPATGVPRPTATAAPPETPAPTATAVPGGSLPAATATPQPAAALSVRISASRVAVVVGQAFQYLIVIQNPAAGESGPATLRVDLADALELLATRSSAGEIQVAGKRLTVQLPSVAAGARLQIELDVRVRQGTASGSIIEQTCELVQGSRLVRAAPALVALPPDHLPPVGEP